MTVITDSNDLASFCARQAKADFLAIDTEFIRDTTYWPKLCLIQVGGPEESAAVDPLAEGIDLSPLYDLLTDPNILKVFHAARQDLEIFYHEIGNLPAPVFDTQVAAMVCGYGDQVSYEKLATQLTGASIDKSARFADWAKRPLTNRQIKYALSDVIYLRPVYEKLRASLEKNNRASWLDEEMAVLTNPDTYNMDPSKAWKRLKTRSRDRRYLGQLHKLAEWRENEAQTRNVPRNRVLRDEQLYDIAAQAPKNADALARTRGLNSNFATGRLGREILETVAQALAIPDKELPAAPRNDRNQEQAGPIVDLLKVLLKLCCEEHGVAQKLVANSADLDQIALNDEAPVAAMSGWRRDLFGQQAIALKSGKLALSANGDKIKIIALN
ncbi:ribonuclease D [Rhodovibrionaceae bacterium A322]